MERVKQELLVKLEDSTEEELREVAAETLTLLMETDLHNKAFELLGDLEENPDAPIDIIRLTRERVEEMVGSSDNDIYRETMLEAFDSVEKKRLEKTLNQEV